MTNLEKATGARIQATKLTISSLGSIPHFSLMLAPSIGEVYKSKPASKKSQHQSVAKVLFVYSCKVSVPTVNALSIYSWLKATSWSNELLGYELVSVVFTVYSLCWTSDVSSTFVPSYSGAASVPCMVLDSLLFASISSLLSMATSGSRYCSTYV